jgi:uncharacterized protein (DUF433 family)
VTNKRDFPAYGAVEAAHCLALPPATVRWWAVGDEKRGLPALIKPAAEGPLCLSFLNLVELYVIASMRRGHGVSMPRLRRAMERSGHARPLIAETFWTEGGDVFIERYSKYFNVSARAPAQAVIKATLEKSMRRVERDTKGLAMRFSPWLNNPAEPYWVEVDPERASGRLVVAKTAIPTEAIAERFFAGETSADLAADFDLSQLQVDAAVRWEHAALLAAA